VTAYVRISLDVAQSDSQLITAAMDAIGALSITIESADGEEIFDESTPGEPRWENQHVTLLFSGERDIGEVEKALSDTLGSSPPISVTPVADQDWERSWLKQFKPIKVGKHVWVCPSWCDVVEPDDLTLIIDPGLAFGTGTHPTTRLCLNYLESIDIADKSVLDFGCGSGILGIAAAKMGADNVIGVDVDPKAIIASNRNATVNQVTQRFAALEHREYSRRPENTTFDIAIANILAGTLIELSCELADRVVDGGWLLLSGVLQRQTESVIQAYQDSFAFTTRQRDDWMLLVGEKKRGR